MTDSSRRFHKAAPLALALGVVGLLAGCADIGGPPAATQMLGQDTYLVMGKFTSVSDTMGVLKRQMTRRANQQCPGGWTKLAEGPNPNAMSGGRIWKIRCTGLNATHAAPAADYGTYVAPPSTAPAAATAMAPVPAATAATAPAKAVTPPADLLRMFTAAAMQAAPDLSQRAAQAIARAQLRSLAAAKMTVTDAAGHPLPLQ